MTGKERASRILKHEKIDRIGLFEHFWGDTWRKWQREGHLAGDETVEDHFGFDIIGSGPFRLVADLDFVPEVVAEDEDTITSLDGNGATLKRHKHHETTPEHVDFSVKDRVLWEKNIKPLLTPSPERINFEAYRNAKKKAEEKGKFFTCGGVNVFESIHPVCGHVNMLMGMIDDPDWIADMVDTYAKLIVELQKILFEAEGCPDGLWYYEDLGYKGSPFMSPQMFRDMILPGYEYSFNSAKSKDLPIIFHSCGFVEPLLPDIVKAGIDCLQVIEVKAGMDLLKLYDLYKNDIAFMGGIDVRVLYSNDKALIDKELEAKIPIVKQNNNFFLHSDHSIPDTVDYETYCYFVERGLELGKY
ncbi:MAG: hypothetical protein FWF08_02800 [Oscillospiraceae bacterium]|nr:hypothetical protein [Oscillospiraceae bacterium]